MTKAKPLPDLKILLDLFSYNPETGIIIHKKTRRGRVKQGAEAGAKRRLPCGNSTKLYIEVKVFGRICLAHRLAWYMHTGVDPVDYFIDHVDGNGYNNIFANLRLCTNQQNAFNRIAQTNNKSGFKGVCWQKKKQKWRAEIALNYKKIYLGYFPTAELAHMAYCKAAAELHGDFARGA
jgi:hypothetical protein